MKSIKKWMPLAAALLLTLSAACGGGGNSASMGSDSINSGNSASTGGEPISAQKQVNDALASLSAEDFTYAQLTGTDSLGRYTLPVVGKEKKYVGIFYFVLLGQKAHNEIYDISKLLAQYGSAMDGSNPLFNIDKDNAVSPYSSFHYWGEPLYGYYKSTDKWVIRRHLELFMNAGIDFLYLDYTNGSTYPAAVRALLDVILEMREEGYKNVPAVAFMCPNAAKSSSAQMGSLEILDYLYSTYYTERKYDSCWFRGDETVNPDGNPLVVGRFSGVKGDEYLDNLWLKEMQWPMNMADTPDAFPWMEWNKPGTTQPNHNGIMNVSVAQHVNSWSSTSYADSLTPGKKYAYRARGWSPDDPDRYGTETERVLAGDNFEWQWENALAVKDDLYMVTLTGWNEWVAQKITYGTDYAVFNDAFNMEFSRDAEMMKGGYSDNYYMQIARNVREFSGIRIDGTDNVALFPRVSPAGIDDVDTLPAKFLDIGGDAVARKDKAINDKIDYSDSSNRNNILETRVGNDGEYLYVAVTTKDPVTAYVEGESAWMTLYLDCGKSGGWENYDFVVNRAPTLENGIGKTGVERFTGTGAQTAAAGNADIAVKGNTIFYKIPLSALGVTAQTVIGIKATDNLQLFGNVEDFYVSGDSAPLGRLNYAYKIA